MGKFRSYFAKRKKQEFREHGKVAVILVAGAMGSRLYRRQLGQKLKGVWDPDRKLMVMYGLTKKTAVVKRRVLGPDATLEVAEDWSGGPDYAEARGWGGPAKSVYGDLLKGLDKRKKKFKRWEVEVHAYGYDWRMSNEVAGRGLAERIDSICDKGDKKKPDEAILVTHSMGGTVARCCCFMSGKADIKDKILGVIHVVQPAMGAPVLYRRFKLGANAEDDGGAFSKIIGTTPEDFATLGGAMKSCTELLPTKDYRPPGTGSRWLSWNKDLVGEKVDLGDNVFDLYADCKGHIGLVPELWLDPNLPTALKPFKDKFENWKKMLLSNIKDAGAFHDELGSQMHPNTYILASSDLKTDLSIRLDSLDKSVYPHRVRARHVMLESGDGTVPITSQLGPLPDKAKKSKKHKSQIVSKIEHSKVFKDSKVREQIYSWVQDILDDEDRAKGRLK